MPQPPQPLHQGVADTAGLEGMSPEEQLVTEGTDYLRDGQTLQGGISYMYRPEYNSPGVGTSASSSHSQEGANRVISRELQMRPLPKVGGDSAEWNIDKCIQELRCQHGTGCRFYHCPAEWRCRAYARDGRCDDAKPNGSCKNGHLHIHAHEVRETIEIDLEVPSLAMGVLHRLQHETQDQRARYVRIFVYGFASTRAQMLKRLLAFTPLLHEIVLPDRPHEDNLIVSVITALEDCAEKAPRLQQVVFADGTSADIWH